MKKQKDDNLKGQDTSGIPNTPNEELKMTPVQPPPANENKPAQAAPAPKKAVVFLKKNAWWLAILLVAVILAGVFWGLQSQKGITLTAVEQTKGGVAPNTVFVLQYPDAPDLATLRTQITIEPEISFALSETKPGEYIIKPEHRLEPGSEITLTVNGKTFSFTVQNILYVLSAMPADNTVMVPVTTGVEFTFNTREISLDSFRSAFSISPSVNGRFTESEGRYVFFPEEEFTPGTNYTVMLDGSLTSLSGAVLGEVYTVHFTTLYEEEAAARDAFSISSPSISVNSLSSEPPLFNAYIGQDALANGAKVDVEVYAYDGPDQYVKEMEKYIDPAHQYVHVGEGAIDTSGLTRTASYSILPVSMGSNEGQYDPYSGNQLSTYAILPFPETLPEGWYAIDFTLRYGNQQRTRHMLLQVSDLSVFYTLCDEEMLFWVNDAATGGAVKGAKIEMTGDITGTGTTGNNGDVLIKDAAYPDPAESGGYSYHGNQYKTLLAVHAGNRSFYALDSGYYMVQDENSSQQYMSYLYCDRTIYRRTDTVEIFGTVRPRNANIPLPKTVTLKLGEDSYYDKEEEAVIEKEVTLGPDGTFKTQIKFEQLSYSWPSLRLCLGGDVLASQYLRVENFIKPAYTAATAAAKPVYLAGDETNISIGLDVTMFDGTPIPGMQVSVSDSYPSGLVPPPGALQTDADGHTFAAVSLNVDENTWRPQAYGYSFNSTDAQNASMYIGGTVYVIHRDVMLQGETTVKNGGGELAITTNKIDISKIETSDQIGDTALLKGAGIDTLVNIQLHKVVYIKVKQGTAYDYTSRQIVETYRYEPVDTVVNTYEVTTSNGTYTLRDLPVSDANAYYYLEMSCKDSRGKTVAEKLYLGGAYSEYYGQTDTGNHRYGLAKVTANNAKDYKVDEYGWYWGYTFIDGETATFALTDNDLVLGKQPGRLLYCVAQKGFTQTGVANGSRFSLPFQEEYLPNYVVTGAYFDGKHVYYLEEATVRYEPEKRELDIQLTPNKDTYAPGDSISVDVFITNKSTGKPAANTTVLLSMVDEAVFAMQDQTVTMLKDMYQSVYYPNISHYTSYLPPTAYGAAGEKGGGGGNEAMRKDFKDTGSFLTATTDANGKVTVKWTLPDNITSWRITSLATNAKGQAGNTKINVNATKNFFVTPIINETLLAGDSVAVGLRSAGRDVRQEHEVQYTVRVTGNGVDKTLPTSSGVRRYTAVDFGALPAGNYTVMVSGVCRSYTDAIQIPFTIAKNGVQADMVRTFDLSGGIQCDPVRYPVDIVFYGAGAKTYNSALHTVQNRSYGTRADQLIGKKYVATLLSRQGAKGYDLSALGMDLSSVNGTYGLISLYPYMTKDVELTVKTVLAAPELTNPHCLENIEGKYNWGDYTGAQSILYLAKALAGEAITADLHEVLTTDTSLDYIDKIYIAMAMYASGDVEGAQQYYNTLVKEHLLSQSGVSGETVHYIRADSVAKTQNECTAAAALFATMLQTQDAEGFIRYLVEKGGKTEPYVLEMMYYLTKFTPTGGQGTTFSYTRDGKTVTESLGPGMKTLSFTKEQLQKANFKVLSGKVYADVYFTGAMQEAQDTANKRIGFTKTVEPVDGAYKVGGLVKITLTLDFANLDTTRENEVLLVDDYVPSGMRYERMATEIYGHDVPVWYERGIEGQQVRFALSRGYGENDDLRLAGPLVYYVRVATPGTYVMESAFVNCSMADSWGMTERQKVVIKPED